VSPDAGVFALVNDLRDPRDPRGRQYPLGAVLLVALCALACRFDSFRAMGQWAAAAPAATLERLGLRRRGAFGLAKAPSSYTIRRAVNAVMPGGLEELLRVFQDKARVVAMDGKCLRGSRDTAGQAVMVLGAMLQDGTLVAQQKVADKGSEITGFAALLAALELEEDRGDGGVRRQAEGVFAGEHPGVDGVAGAHGLQVVRGDATEGTRAAAVGFLQQRHHQVHRAGRCLGGRGDGAVAWP
jgi:hypothetical protein